MNKVIPILPEGIKFEVIHIREPNDEEICKFKHTKYKLEKYIEGGQLMALCICGLDHYEPLPKKFDVPPIVGIYPPGEYRCHVCGATSKTNALFNDPDSHNPGCKFAETLMKTSHSNK